MKVGMKKVEKRIVGGGLSNMPSKIIPNKRIYETKLKKNN